MNGENFSNYFNYFTEVEEQFQRSRGTSLFLLSPLDWALIEGWKNSGVPLQAVLRGIDIAFEKWRAKKSRVQMVNSLAYCSQAVMQEAQRMADGGQPRGKAPETSPFPADELRKFMAANAAAVRASGIPEFSPVAELLEQIVGDLPALSADLESLEQRLTALEQKMVAITRARQTDGDALKVRAELEAYLRPWRTRMTAPQIAMLESQFLERAALESAGLPRLSLFYLR